jgi:hypothetical protein
MEIFVVSNVNLNWTSFEILERKKEMMKNLVNPWSVHLLYSTFPMICKFFFDMIAWIQLRIQVSW